VYFTTFCEQLLQVAIECLQVFTTAATDEHKSIVLLAFETIEKIVREYFPYITETETTTFTDCVNCLIAFTNSRFNKDVSLNAIAFLRFCALKLAEGDIGSARSKLGNSVTSPKQGESESPTFTDKDDHLYFWFPLLAGWLACDSVIFHSFYERSFDNLRIALVNQHLQREDTSSLNEPLS
jgi:hypothetical protein